MNIESISVENFRNFGEEKTFNLNPNLTTIIGINGKGKSSLLTALKIAAGTYLLGIPEAQKRHIGEREIRLIDHKLHLSRITPTIIRATGSIDGVPLMKPWARQIPEGRMKTTASVQDVGEIKSIAEGKYAANQLGDTNVDHPIIAFFGTRRSNTSSKNTLGPYIGRDIFKLGYYRWVSLETSFYNYVKWIQGHRFAVKEGRETVGMANSFFHAIHVAVPYIKKIDFDGIELRLKVKMPEEAETPFLPLSLHSDGIRTYTGMIAEIAYRCLILNGHLDKLSIAKTRGIVMIDEIDLHIHPVWQRHILKDLKAAFPLIQFVVTTHSPFIIQSLESNELINLDVVADIAPNELSLNDVSTHIMQVDSEFSEENENKYDEAKSLFKLLNEDNLNKNLSDEKIKNVSDPVLRAFLEVSKTAKGRK